MHVNPNPPEHGQVPRDVPEVFELADGTHVLQIIDPWQPDTAWFQSNHFVPVES